MEHTERISFSVGLITRIAKGRPTKGNLKWNNSSSISFFYYPSESILVLSYIINNATSINQQIKLVSTPSNLGNGDTLFFICPDTQKKCRKLYLYENSFVSRYAIPHLYKKCNRSRKWRIFDLFIEFESLNTKYRKLFYKDRITPFGKSLFAKQERQAKALELFEQYFLNEPKKHKN